MSDIDGTDPETTDNDRPTFKGCVFCYSGAWAAHIAKKGYRAVSK